MVILPTVGDDAPWCDQEIRPEEPHHDFEAIFEASPKYPEETRQDIALDLLPKFTSNELRFGPRLGTGQFGTVHEISHFKLRKTPHLSRKQEEKRQQVASNCRRAECKSPLYAIKSPPPICKNDAHTKQALDDLAGEAHFLARVDHQNVIKLYGTSRDAMGSKHCFLLLDRLYETLEDRLESWSAKEVKARSRAMFQKGSTTQRGWMLFERLSYALDACSALAHLHRLGIMHRDVKPGNIGFDIRGDLKLFDFGLATNVEPEPTSRRYTACAGTVRYMAPENFLGLQYDDKVDVYSFAILLWEMVELRVPFRSVDMASFKSKVVNGGRRPNIKRSMKRQNRWNKPLTDFITRCWAHSPFERYSSRRAHEELYRILYLSAQRSATVDEDNSVQAGASTVMSTQSLHGTAGSSPLRRKLLRRGSTRNMNRDWLSPPANFQPRRMSTLEQPIRCY